MQTSTQITFRSFQPGDEEDFIALNEQWIAKYFALEEEDIQILRHPQKHILDPGGRIYFALIDEKVVGCCALIVQGLGSYQVAKMAVNESYRNQGIGKAMLAYVIDEAKAIGAYRLTLETNSVLQNAIHVYASLGFRHIDPSRIEPSPFKRANVFMERYL